MATDPNTTDDQKRRLREREQQEQRYINLGINGRQIPVDAPLPGRTGRSMSRPTEPPASAVNPARAAAQDARTAFVDAANKNTAAQEAALPARGITRLMKGRGEHGENVYTNVPGDGLIQGEGEERFYGAYGDRIGRGLQRPGAAADVAPGEGRAAAYAQQTRDFYSALDTENAPQLRALGRAVADAKDTPDPGYGYVLDEQGRTTLTTAQERASRGLGRRGAAGASGPDFGDQIALMRLQRDTARDEATDARNARLDERAEAQQQSQDLERLVTRWRGDPQATMQEELAFISPLRDNPEALQKYFDEHPRGKMLSRLLNTQARQAYDSSDINFFGLRDTPRNLGDLRQSEYGPNYVTDADSMRTGISLEDIGLSPDDEWLMDFFAQQNARGR